MENLKLLMAVILLGCFATESSAKKYVEEKAPALPKGSYQKSCSKCKTSTSPLTYGYTLTCKCSDWDKKLKETSLNFSTDGCNQNTATNCNGKLVCGTKCPKRKKFLGLF